MKLAVTLEHRFAVTPDGKAWALTMFPRSFWDRYLEVFDGVSIVARAIQVATPGSGWSRVDGGGVNLVPLPYYKGPVQYLLRRWPLERKLRGAIDEDSAVLLRVGSPIADLAVPFLRRRGQPFAVEVLGDPWGSFAPGAVRHPLRPVLRRILTRNLRGQCKGACGAGYVTENALQRRYPPGPDTFSTHYSDVMFETAGPDSAERSVSLAGAGVLVAVGSLEQMYKGFDVLIEALAACVSDRGLNLRLEIVGGGRHRDDLRALAARMGLTGRIVFHGQLPAGSAVREVLDRADLFVMPSRQEGLPRALIEAMARGLPCIGSDVGGIPELLAPEDLVPAGDAVALGERIATVLKDPERLTRMAARNFARAADYREEIQAERRRALYRHLLECTRKWQEGRR